MILPPTVYRDFVLDAWLDWRREGKACALLTLVKADGASPRPVGSQMAVCEDGRSVGLISGGCIERTLVLDAMAAMQTGRNHVERYGEGSRFKDLRLPCGSGIDIHFDMTMEIKRVESVLMELGHRRATFLDLDFGDQIFTRTYRPPLYLKLFGQGPIVQCTARMAHELEMKIAIHTPDDETLDRLKTDGFLALPLEYFFRWDFPIDAIFDRFSAVLTLFHDHDREPEILAQALRSEALYIGALGSRTAQASRLNTLKQQGFSDDDLARIHGPVGLDIGAATPPEIALSALAEIVACYRKQR